MRKSIIYIIMCIAFLSACQDENAFGPNYKPDKMGHMMKLDKADITFGASTNLTQTIQVKARGPHWKFEGIPDWLTISQATGIGDMAITFTATENTATEARTAILHFMADEQDFTHSKDISVRQEGVAIVYHTSAPATPLSFKADVTDSPQTISVTSNEEWTVTVTPAVATWCTVTQSATNGNGKVTVTATENKSLDTRTATITIKGKTSGDETKVSVTQTGTKPATIATPTELPEFNANGGSQDITVTSNEEWTVTVTPADVLWCSVSPSTDANNGKVTVTATENKTIDPRTATIIIKGKTSGDESKVSIKQKGAEPYITVSPQKWEPTSSDADSQTITVSSNTSWTCTSSDATWCKVTPTSDTSATVTITANTTTKERKATLTFKASTKEATVEVTQPGLNAEISVSPTSIEFEQKPTNLQTVTVTCNEEWKMPVSNATWCKVENKTATGFTVTAETNQSFSSRSATITVTSNSGKTATVSVIQKGGTINYEDYDEDKELLSGQTTYTANGVSFVMVAVEGGTFQMGATNEQGSDAWDYEKPVHQVTVSSFSIGQTEVTQALWYAVMGQKPTTDGNQWNSTYGLGDNRPAYYVSWNDCQEFIIKLNQITGQQFRLPTEAEWEFAARGGNKSNGYKYSGSNTIGDVAWYTANSSSKTHDVATKQANELGIYDMSGNVWEWCSDWFGSYSSSAQTNPTGPASGSYRVYRGGSWGNDARDCRVAFRINNPPTLRGDYLGLRLAL